MSYRSITIEGTSIDMSERLIVESFARTYAPESQGQADLVKQCWTLYNLPENKARREIFKRLRLMYQDRQEKQFVEDVLRPLMGKESNGTYKYDAMPTKPLVSITNIVKRIVDKQATLYDAQPKRDVDDESSDESYGTMAKDIGLDYIMQAFERTQVLYKTAFLRPVVRHEQIDVDVLSPEIFYPITDPDDNTRIIACFWVVQSPLRPESALHCTWYYLDTVNFFWFQMVNGALIKIQGTDDMPGSVMIGENENESGEVTGNVLGDLGILKACTNKTDEVIEYPGDSVVSLQNNINILETLMTNSLIYQGFPIKHIHGFDIVDNTTGERRSVSSGPWDVIVTQGRPGEEKPSVEFVAPATNVKEFIDAIDKKINSFLLSAGIPKNLIIDVATSGTALAERNRDIIEIRKSKIPQYKKIEQELYTLIARICEVSDVKDADGKALKLNPDAVLTVEYDEPEVNVLTELEQAQVDQQRIDQGLISPFEIMKRDHPDMEDDAIREYLAEVKTETGTNSNIFKNVKAQANSVISNALGQNAGTNQSPIQEQRPEGIGTGNGK